MATRGSEALLQARHALKKLTVFRKLGDNDQVIPLFDELLTVLLDQCQSCDQSLMLYHQLTGKLLEHTVETPFVAVGNIWQDYLLDNLLLLENPFTHRASQWGIEKLSPRILAGVSEDLAALGELYHFDPQELKNALEKPGDRPLLSWQDEEKEMEHIFAEDCCAAEVKMSFHQEKAWCKLLEPLIFYYQTAGTGYFSYCHAFRFQGRGEEGLLKPIFALDPIRLANLIGCERQIQEVTRNTEQFLQGFPANNLLLYGDRGTGKSSTIKALVHEYGRQGLRMVELTKQDLGRLPDVLDVIRDRPHRFIIFIDDLSFEEGEMDYKHMKAVLEGSLEARPQNVLIYATSNRRHLIKERFSDREFTGDGEVRTQDTLQEKLSLADRFGMTITFTSPDQDQYLAIVESLAQQEGLILEPHVLREEALKWALWHNGRSGRTARQFIDDLMGRIGMEADSNP